MTRKCGRSLMVQKNGTPWMKPRNSGGSPSGVRAPPMLATRKMKKMKTCALCRRARVGAKHRPDHQHRGACRAHPRRQHGPDDQHQRVERGRPDQRSAQEDPARHGVEPPQQDQERHVVDERDLEDLVDRRRPRTRPRTGARVRAPRQRRRACSAWPRTPARAAGRARWTGGSRQTARRPRAAAGVRSARPLTRDAGPPRCSATTARRRSR